MNFLAHLYLSGSDPELLVGNLLGDFVKGRLVGDYPRRVEQGIVLHRRIDSYCNGNSQFIRSKRRIDPSFGHYRGVMVDLFYDHFLAAGWEGYSDESLPEFIRRCREMANTYRNIIPARVRTLLPYIFGELLPSYREVGGVERALFRMSARLRRPSPLGAGGVELRRLYNDLKDDFHFFLPGLQDFVEKEKGRLA